MPFFILSVLVQVAFVTHIVKTGRNTTWIWIVIMLPLAGAIAYILLEILPDISNSRGGRRASRKLRSVVNPNKNLNDAARQYTTSDTVESAMRFAEQCLSKGLYTEAKSLYQKSLSGLHADDPYLMFGLAKAEFQLGNLNESRVLLEQLIEKNPDFKNQDAHLLYARALDGLNKMTEALHEYETLHSYFVGPEATYYFARFLKSQNQLSKANELLNEILMKAKLSNKHYSVVHADIIKQAKRELIQQS